MLEREGGTLSVPEAFESDALLVASLLQGNSDAAGSLFDRYGGYIQRVLARILGYSEPERADLLHEVFVRALERLADLKNARALKPWLVGIAVFTAQEWLRQRKRRGPLLPEEDGAARESLDATPEAREAVRSFYQRRRVASLTTSEQPSS